MEGEKKTVKFPEIVELLKGFIEKYKAGSPTDETIYWISIKPSQMALMFYQEHQIKVSNSLVKALLRELGYRYRKQSKQLATGNYARRDEQFTIIFSLVLMMSGVKKLRRVRHWRVWFRFR